MEQVTLEMSEFAQQALNYAFDEAQQRLSSIGLTDPFTVTVVDEGLEVNDHPASSPSAVRESVKMLLAQDMPAAYVLCYDGDVETDDGTLDCLVAEVADRGAMEAYILVLLYTKDAQGYEFEQDYAFAGPAQVLYPAGTKPVTSGLAALQEEESQSEVTSEPETEPALTPETEPALTPEIEPAPAPSQADVPEQEAEA